VPAARSPADRASAFAPRSTPPSGIVGTRAGHGLPLAPNPAVPGAPRAQAACITPAVPSRNARLVSAHSLRNGKLTSRNAENGRRTAAGLAGPPGPVHRRPHSLKVPKTYATRRYSWMTPSRKSSHGRPRANPPTATRGHRPYGLLGAYAQVACVFGTYTTWTRTRRAAPNCWPTSSGPRTCGPTRAAIWPAGSSTGRTGSISASAPKTASPRPAANMTGLPGFLARLRLSICAGQAPM
jgi:hypothetical protein